MPNKLDSVVVDPVAVKSGDKTTVTVRYQSTQDDDLLISCSAAFIVDPKQVRLTKSTSGQDQFNLTITRVPAVAPDECTVHFSFHGDERDRIVEVS